MRTGHDRRFGEQNVGLSIADLTPARTYHFRVVLENKAHEKTVGPDQPLTTLSLEKPAVEPGVNPPSLTPFEATVEGLVNPESQTTTYELEYSTTKPAGAKLEGRCDGRRHGCPGGLWCAAGEISTGAVLTPATTYYYQLLATNETGTTEGVVESFETPPTIKPRVESESTQGVTPFEATLDAQVNPNYQKTTYLFEYATNEALTGDGNNHEHQRTGRLRWPDRERRHGQHPDTGCTYYYRVIATNKTGTTNGPVEKFEVPALVKPTVENENASFPTPLEGTLEAQIEPDYQPTTCEIQYGLKHQLLRAAHTLRSG